MPTQDQTIDCYIYIYNSTLSCAHTAPIGKIAISWNVPKMPVHIIDGESPLTRWHADAELVRLDSFSLTLTLIWLVIFAVQLFVINSKGVTIYRINHVFCCWTRGGRRTSERAQHFMNVYLDSFGGKTVCVFSRWFPQRAVNVNRKKKKKIRRGNGASISLFHDFFLIPPIFFCGICVGDIVTREYKEKKSSANTFRHGQQVRRTTHPKVP